jgi:hypothetical protein
MSNWYKETILIIVIIIGSLKIHNLNAIARSVDRETNSTDRSTLLNFKLELQPPFLVTRDWRTCQQLDEDYREVYGFETQNFYINICQYGQQFIYYRQAKADPTNVVMIPAETVFGGEVFQASEGRITYFVGIDSNGYYSSVMKNDNELVVEPELQAPSATISNDRDININANSKTEVSPLNLNSYKEKANRQQVCTENKYDNHPRFKGWQKFIGKSPDLAFDYANDNGHNFAYSNNNLQKASIETADGLMVTFDITSASQKIGQVCVNPIVSNYHGL